MTNLQIVKTLISLGYSLMGYTAEEFADRFDNETLTIFLQAYKEWKGVA